MLNRLRAFCAAAMLLLVTIAPQIAFAQQTQLPNGKQCFSGTTGVTGMVGTLGTITAGTGGTAGTYANVSLTGGAGSGATANITISAGGVTAVAVLNPGTGYQVNDILSASSGAIGGTTGFSVPVASTALNSALAGGSVGMYIPGTLTTKQTYQNQAGSILNTNPVQLDSNGCAILFGSGAYRQIVYDSLGNELWDQNTYAFTSNPFWASLAGGTGNAITVADSAFSATDGQSIQFVALSANTGATTITPSGTGIALSVDKNSPSGPVPLTGNEIAAGDLVTVTYYASQNYFLLDSYNRISAAMTPVVTASTTAAAAGAMGLNFGQGYFSAVTNGGTQVQFCPVGGSYVTIQGADYAIPSACVTSTITNCYINGVAAQSLIANNLYYVYVFNNSGTLTIDFSTNGHITDSTAGNVGIEIESGNNTRSLIGMVYPQSGPVVDSAGANILVLSWFGKKDINGHNWFTTNRTTTSTSYTEINSEIRVQFLTWANQTVSLKINGAANNSSGSTIVNTSIAVDSTTNSLDTYTSSENSIASGPVPVQASATSTFSEGYHYATVLGAVSAATGTWAGSGSFAGRVTLDASVKG